MLSNIYGVMNMIANAMVTLFISDENCRCEAVSSNILKGFYFS